MSARMSDYYLYTHPYARSNIYAEHTSPPQYTLRSNPSSGSTTVVLVLYGYSCTAVLYGYCMATVLLLYGTVRCMAPVYGYCMTTAKHSRQ